MFTIGQVAKKYGLSRSTLLYYDKIGVLNPSGRSEANYRLYTSGDLERMDRIMLFRSAGLSLETIRDLLDREGGDFDISLEHRLSTISILCLGLGLALENTALTAQTRVMNKETWVSILRASGLDEAGMRNWHIEFEKTSPEAHQDFLESIGIEKEEIELIRDWSRPDNQTS